MAAHKPTFESTPTLQDLPDLRRVARVERERALATRFDTGTTEAGFEMHGTCVGCGADVHSWRNHLADLAALTGPEEDEAGVQLRYPDACGVCGGSDVKVHAGQPRAARQSSKDLTDVMPRSAPPSPKVFMGKSAPTVLVVDDDAELRALLVMLLGRRYTVFEAADGVRALDLLTKIEPPDLILLDVMMPRIDGINVAARVREEPRLQGVPIVFLSAKDATADIVAGINAGARHYVTKPFTERDLMEKVARAIDAGSATIREG
jgi:CheY-like chemotaxis protein/Fe-S cluster biogenesis protein NfuA